MASSNSHRCVFGDGGPKSTAYRRYVNDVADFSATGLTQRGIQIPQLESAIQQAIERGEQDIYLPTPFLLNNRSSLFGVEYAYRGTP